MWVAGVNQTHFSNLEFSFLGQPQCKILTWSAYAWNRTPYIAALSVKSSSGSDKICAIGEDVPTTVLPVGLEEPVDLEGVLSLGVWEEEPGDFSCKSIRKQKQNPG